MHVCLRSVLLIPHTKITDKYKFEFKGGIALIMFTDKLHFHPFPH